MLQVGDALFERVNPVGHFHTEGFLDGSLVEYGVGRTGYWRRIFRAVAGLYVALCVAGYAGYHLCEVVPGAHSLVGEMIDAGVFRLVVGRLYLV